jgi:AcrR family transcriptional regulator
MALLRTPRRSWVEAGLGALATGGPDAVRIEALAESLGVTKGGFYGQFGDRGELLAEMLDTWESRVFDEVMAQVESGGGDARAKLWRLFTLATGGAGMADMEQWLSIELAIRDWARRDPSVAQRLRHVDDRRMEYMRTLFGELCTDEGEVEARCLLAFTLFIGNHLVGVGHGPLSRGDVLELAVRKLLVQPGLRDR